MSVLIKGGRIVTASDDYLGDVYAENGTVSMIGQSLDLDADRVIDATGKYVIPGAIDPHPGRVLRRHRPPADDRARLERRRRSSLLDLRHCRPDRA